MSSTKWASDHRWHAGRDSFQSDVVKRQRLLIEEANSEWTVEKHYGCENKDAIRKTKFGKRELHLSCYDKNTGKRHCFSTQTLLFLHMRDNKFLEPPNFQKMVKPSTHKVLKTLLKKIPNTTLDNDEEELFEVQFSRYIGGLLPKEDIHCCPICYEDARAGIEGVDPLKIFVDLGLNGEVKLQPTIHSCFLTRNKLKAHMDIVHNVNKERKAEMKLTLDKFMLRKSGSLVDRYCNTINTNFRHYYWDLNRVKMYLAMFEHRKKADSQTCETWNRVHGVIDNDSEASDETFIVGDLEVEAEQATLEEENHRRWAFESQSDDEVATVIMGSSSPRCSPRYRKKRKKCVVDSDEESDTELEYDDSNHTERFCIFCVDVEMVEMNTQKHGFDQICCDGGWNCPQKGYPLEMDERFYGCKSCNEYDLCEACYRKH